MKVSLAMSLSMALLAAGCSTWLPASHQAPATLTAAPIPTALTPHNNDWPAASWWRKYDDDTLNALIIQALASAPSIANAEARFNSARESIRISAASSGLHVDAQATVARQRLSDNGLFPIEFLGFSWYTQADLGLKASYSFDWWHKRQAITEAAIDEARAAQAERAAAGLSLAAAVADSYFGWQADQAQLALLDEQIQLLTRRQKITAARIRADLEAADGQLQLEGDLAALRVTRISLATSAELHRVVIAALLGTSVDQLPAFVARALPSVDAHLPDSVRVDLLARRPDIAASRWHIEAAQQQLQAARAEFMPDISINALAALSSIDLGKLLNAGSSAPSIGAAIHLPIFDSGLLKAQYGARAAMLNSAVASYNGTIISAAREVASQALTLQQLGEQREQRQAQIDAANQLVNVNAARHTQGLSDGRAVLMAQQMLHQQQAALISLDVAALSADINLQLALGGGYSPPNSNNTL